MPSGLNYYLVIVSPDERPLFEMHFPAPTSQSTQVNSTSVVSEPDRFLPFVAHAALDQVDEQLFSSGSQQSMFLRTVDHFADRFTDWSVAAFVTATRARFLLVYYYPVGSQPSVATTQSAKATEDAIRNFFQELYELFTKFTRNPFYERWSRFNSPTFSRKALLLANKYL